MIEECIKTSWGFTRSTFYNVCDGSTAVVPHGSMDMVGMVLLFTWLALMVGVFGLIIYKIAKD